LAPKEIDIAVPNIASRMADARETHRGHSPTISRIPSVVSVTVAVHAREGMIAAGKKEFTCAVY
jgi:hypothetical protein